MLSAALAGLLRVGAVTLTAAGLGTGIYFLVQVGEGQDAGPDVVATATLPAQEGVSPPVDIVAPGPTTTFPPAPTPPSDINTSDWPTYSSPLGFAIKYPPGWTLHNLEDQGLATGAARILNPRAEELLQSGVGSGELGDDPGVGWIDLYQAGLPFDISAFMQICQPDETAPSEYEGPPEVATQVTVAGRRAVVCQGEDVTLAGLPMTVIIYWIELATGQVAQITANAVDLDAAAVEMIEASLATFSPGQPP